MSYQQLAPRGHARLALGGVVGTQFRGCGQRLGRDSEGGGARGGHAGDGAGSGGHAGDSGAVATSPAVGVFQPRTGVSAGTKVRAGDRIAVASRRGEIWFVDDPAGEQPTWTRFAHGLHEVLGLAWKDGWLYVTQRPEVEALHRAGSERDPTPRSHREVFFPERGTRLRTPIFVRHSLPVGFGLEGPAVIEEFGATTVLSPSDRLVVGELGELRIEVAQ